MCFPTADFGVPPVDSECSVHCHWYACMLNHAVNLLMQILNTRDAAERLVMNDRYFFGLLDRMTTDVGRQPNNLHKAPLLEQLQEVKKEAQERLSGS